MSLELEWLISFTVWLTIALLLSVLSCIASLSTSLKRPRSSPCPQSWWNTAQHLVSPGYRLKSLWLGDQRGIGVIKSLRVPWVYRQQKLDDKEWGEGRTHAYYRPNIEGVPLLSDDSHFEYGECKSWIYLGAKCLRRWYRVYTRAMLQKSCEEDRRQEVNMRYL